MNKDWSDANKRMQRLMKRDTFSEGIGELLSLRAALMDEIESWKDLPREAFSAMPFPNAAGYHSKTAAYSLWHIFRIEDITVNSLVRKREEVLFTGRFAEKTHSPIITTGNELRGEEIAEFSRKLDIDALYEYIRAVNGDTDAWLKTLDFPALKTVFADEDRQALRFLNVVSEDENAAWLIDYWCGKDLKGLIFMPMSRHRIMHVEAAMRIIAKVCGGSRNGTAGHRNSIHKTAPSAVI